MIGQGRPARVIEKLVFVIRAVVSKVFEQRINVRDYRRLPAEYSTEGGHFIASDVFKVEVLKYSLT